MLSEDFLSKNHVNVSRETFGRLKIFYDTLLLWNQTHNLISKTTVNQIWQRHILDSLQLIKFISNANLKIVDMGSGAGFPGIVIAIAKSIPIVLIEANEKKCFFLREIQRLLSLNVTILSQRIETLAPLQADVVTSRALGSLKDLLKFSDRHLSHIGKCLFLKGAQVDQEIQDAQKDWCFDVVKHSSLSCSKGAILEITNICKYK